MPPTESAGWILPDTSWKAAARALIAGYATPGPELALFPQKRHGLFLCLFVCKVLYSTEPEKNKSELSTKAASWLTEAKNCLKLQYVAPKW